MPVKGDGEVGGAPEASEREDTVSDDRAELLAAIKAKAVVRGDVVLASGQDEPTTIAVDATSVYWTTLGDGTVMRLTPK